MSTDTDYFVERSASLKTSDGRISTRTLADWRHLDAYVLLGEPGAGKSTAFEREASAIGSGARYVTARSLLTVGPPAGWTKEILFIDALDERRGDSAAFLSSLDELRRTLVRLGSPRFRLSCREADWYVNGLAELAEVAPGGKVEALWLNALTTEDVESMLQQWSPERVANPRDFLTKAHQNGMTPLLGNPLLLGLIVDAVSGNDWPSSREATYELACGKMAVEHNAVRRRNATPFLVPVPEMLATAGQLCALMLLSDAHAFTADPNDDESGVIQFISLPMDLIGRPKTTTECLNSKLFVSEGDRRLPRHRTIAEFLAAKALADRIRHGLPVQRVLAMMSGRDGRIAEPLRGLYAWLAVHCAGERPYLVDRDALALIMYGDVRHFSVSEKGGVLASLYREGERFRWFRNENWDEAPFGALGTADMEETFRRLLAATAREPAHQTLLDCVTDAIEQGEPELSLPTELERVARDSSYWPQLRRSALDAWLSKKDYNVGAAKRLLDDIRANAVADEDDQLAGGLLTVLYPAHMSTSEALSHQRPRRQQFHVGRFHMFWAVDFLMRIPSSDLPEAADLLVARLASEVRSRNDEHAGRVRDETRDIALRVVAAALRDDAVGPGAARLYDWLGAGVNEYGSFEANGEEADVISDWLSHHPEQRRQAFAYGLSQVVPEIRDGRRYFWVAEERMFRSKRGEGWFQWLLEIAKGSSDVEVVRYCLQAAARAAVDEVQGQSIAIEEIETWVSRSDARWPLAEQWKAEVFVWPLDAYQGVEYARQQKQRSKATADRIARQQQFAPHLAAIYSGSANPHLLDHVCNAYSNRYPNIQGETGLDRVQDLLVVGSSQASQAIEGIKASLQRTDLPSVDAIASTLAEGKVLYLNSVCLLGAKLIHDEQPDAWRNWSATLVETMLAFCLTGTESSSPSWYNALAAARPEVLAPILLRFAAPEASREADPQLRQLYALRDNAEILTPLARLVVPKLWSMIPTRPSEGQLRFVQNVIIPASTLHLDESLWRSLMEEKLADADIGDALAVALHVVVMQFDVQRHCQALVNLCKDRPALLSVLGDTLLNRRRDEIGSLGQAPVQAGQLAALLASSTSPETPMTAFTPSDRQRDAAQALVRAIAENPAEAAGVQLRWLRELPSLRDWAVQLDSLVYDHERVANRKSFKGASSSLVTQVLLNAAPANSRDMSELVRDHLSQLARRIRFEESNLLKNFHRPGPLGRTRKGATAAAHSIAPKIENDCRDLILGLLRDRLLNLNVQIEKESYAAEDKRADMQASTIADGRRIVAPIEVKKDDHPEVWTAWRDQLERRYSLNPAAEGMGIYLVLWFGHKSTRTPEKVKPRSAEHMAELLNEQIPADRRMHIVGLVVDLSPRN